MNHLTWETLNDLVDGLLPTAAVTAAESHARECPSCAKALAELRATLAVTHALPSSLTPPEDLWDDVRTTIEAGKMAQLPLGSAPARARGIWMTPGSLAAAAVVLIAVTASLTSIAVKSGPSVPVAAEAPTLTTAAAWQASERVFQASVVELRSQLESLHDHLSPGTLVKVEKALATIDLAIAEGREALLRDPSNAALSELVASNYRQKIELLRRVTQLASS
jgi:anti-sigma factor RsiW